MLILYERETTRLLLRNLQRGDLDAMVAIWTDNQVAVFMEDFGPRTAAQVAEWLPLAIEAGRDPGGAGCTILEKSTGEIVGWIGFGVSNRGVAPVDFAYVIAANHRGKGYAAEALRCVIDFTFDELGVTSVWGECHVDNAASARVMTAAGLHEIGIVDGQRRFVVERFGRSPTPAP